VFTGRVAHNGETVSRLAGLTPRAAARSTLAMRLVGLPALALYAVPWQCSLVAHELARPPVEPAAPPGPKQEHTAPRETIGPAARNGKHDPALQRVLLAEEVILRALDVGRPGFVRCFKRATDDDPLLTSFKVKIRLELDDTGRVTSGTTDATTTLGNCLLRVAFTLPYPAPGKPAFVELPLFYRAE
jgi:hypothetical protein